MYLNICLLTCFHHHNIQLWVHDVMQTTQLQPWSNKTWRSIETTYCEVRGKGGEEGRKGERERESGIRRWRRRREEEKKSYG